MAFLHSRFNSSLGISSDEMLEICQDINQKFAPEISIASPVLPSKFKSNELLAISEEISRNFSPCITPEDQPKLVILPVDPEHLYAYWHIPEQHIAQTDLKVPDPEPLTLRIYNQAHFIDIETPHQNWFDIQVAQPLMQQKIRLPTQKAIGSYSATLGKPSIENAFAELAYSNHIHLPRARTDFPQNFESWVLPQVEPQAMLFNQVSIAGPHQPLPNYINQY